MTKQHVLSTVVIGAVLGGAVAAQVGRGGSEWLTAGGDAQRTSWIRSDAKISLETMSKPGFERQWTAGLDNRARGLNGLTQGVSANGVTLFVPMTVIAGSSNNVYGIDNDTGYVVWTRKFEGTLPAATAACAGGLVAAPTRLVGLVPPPVTAAAGAGAGRGGAAAGYRSMVGEPGEGAPVEGRAGGAGRAAGGPPAAPGAAAPGAPGARQGQAGAPPAAGAGAPPAAGAARQGGGGAGRGAGGPGIPGAPASATNVGGLGRPSGVVYVVSPDGLLHVMGLPSGKDIQKPAPFIPANAQWSDAIAVNTTLYASTSAGCGTAPNGVWAIDLESEAKPVTSWKNDGGVIVGRIAFTQDGTVIAAIGPGKATGDGKVNAIVALDGKTLQVKDWYTEPAAEFVTGPTILRHNGKDLVAAATRDGRVVLLDASSLGGPTHAAALAKSAPIFGAGGAIAADAIAAWHESMPGPPVAPAAPGAPPTTGPATPGPSWILVPITGKPAAATATNGAITTGAVVALKLGAGAAPTLDTGWTSANLTRPATPVVVNGVVFALATGRPATAAGAGTAAVLHAYDGVTGKALWNSQKAMTTFASPGAFWSSFGQAYVGTHDGKLHAFGFLDERR